jgi:hypothetical protein
MQRGAQSQMGGVAYVLPLRWAEPGPIAELAAYLRLIAAEVDELLVVDGSPAPLFEHHAAALAPSVRHLAPHPDLHCAMGKVNGVITGVRECSHELVVLADDDVRYDRAALRRTIELLAGAELVRPQNYFDSLPWHARWDTARSLLNRVFTGDLDFPVGDFPGTLAVRRSTLLATGGYDGDALFENLELMRTVRAAGGRVLSPLDLYVARVPPSAAHFLSQRVRQAYDDFAMPARLGFFLSLGPLAALAFLRRRPEAVLGGALATVAAAELGRRRAGGTRRFPLGSSLLAPTWVAERAVCSWLALAARLQGGVRYGGGRLGHAATPLSRLRRRYSGLRASAASSLPSHPAAEDTPLSARNPIAL